jgi:hypothetical protein
MATSAITDTQKVDLLFKKNFGYGRTAANVSTTAEVVASPPPLRGDLLWLQADKILLTPGPVKDIVVEHKGDTAVKLVPATTNKLAGSTTDIFQAYRANDGSVDLKNWISADFGAQYSPVLYMVDADTAPSNLNPGTLLSPDGTGGDGQWVFDCQSGVLNFINNTIPGIKLAPSPNTFTDKKTLYLRAYRYVGTMGVQNLAVQGPVGPVGPDGIPGPAGAMGASGPLPSGVHDGNYLYWNASAWAVGGDESVYLGGGAGVGGIGGSGAAGPGNVAIGTATAAAGQHIDAIAIGRGAGTASVLDAQSESAVAIGALAGGDAGKESVAIGAAAGQFNGVYGVSVGSASQSKGSSAVSVGYGATATGNNSIVINATGVQLTAATASTCRIAPIAAASSATGLNPLCYNPGTFEVVTTAPSYLYASNAFWDPLYVYNSFIVRFRTCVASAGWTVSSVVTFPVTSSLYTGNRYMCRVPGVYECTFSATVQVPNQTYQVASIGIEVVSAPGALPKNVASSAVDVLPGETVTVTTIGVVQLEAGESIQCVCTSEAKLLAIRYAGSAGSFTAVRIGGIPA